MPKRSPFEQKSAIPQESIEAYARQIIDALHHTDNNPTLESQIERVRASMQRDYGGQDDISGVLETIGTLEPALRELAYELIQKYDATT